MLSDKVAVKILQGHFGHCYPFLCVITHGWAGCWACHCHGCYRQRKEKLSVLELESTDHAVSLPSGKNVHWSTLLQDKLYATKSRQNNCWKQCLRMLMSSDPEIPSPSIKADKVSHRLLGAQILCTIHIRCSFCHYLY